MRRNIGISFISFLCVEAVVLPDDNSKKEYRESPEIFFQVWPSHPLLDGNMPNGTKVTDVSVYDLERSWGGFEVVRDALFPLEVEKKFLVNQYLWMCRTYWWAGYVASALYLVSLRAGASYMKYRKPFSLRAPLALWNLFLAVFSIIGMSRTVPHLALMLYEQGFEYSVCRDATNSYGNGAAGFWIFLFILSKYFELIDTAFLVLRKKPVLFLHWYHHSSVLLYCWHSFVFAMPTGIYFAAMNYTVHAIMYLYYFLAAILPKPPKWATMVTVLQLAQMVGGIAVTVKHLQILLSSGVQNCDGHIPNLTGALAMYASYFILFAEFFAKRYCTKRNNKNAKGALRREGDQSIKRD